MAEPVGRRHATRDGRRIAYTVVPGGPARVVLVSGTGLPGAFWTIAQTEDFSEWATCLLVDNAGSGATDPLREGAWSASEMAEDVLAALDDVGWDRAHFAGHSLGTAICVHVAESSPARVRSLSLHSTWAGTDRAPHLQAWLEARQATAHVADASLWMRYAFFLVGPAHFAEHGFAGGALAKVASLVATTGSSAHVGQYDAGLGYRGAELLAQLTAPTLVTGGEWDLVTLAEYGRTVAGMIRDARYHEFTSAGHMSALESTAEFNETQRQFVLSVDG